ncbi:MAG: hypothetical protein IJN58_08310 [Clostridia bacterium]|nr:hypothetical protein [Clostridia bacterium]
MSYIKRGTTPVIVVVLENVANSDVDSIEFIFKHRKSESAPAICTKKYPSDFVAYDAANNTYQVSLSEWNTRAMAQHTKIFMDTKITLTTGVIPPTEIAEFQVEETLFPAEV